jgi:hypothetical protein
LRIQIVGHAADATTGAQRFGAQTGATRSIRHTGPSR